MLDSLETSDGTDLDVKRLSKRLLAYARARCGHLDLAKSDRAVQGVSIQDLASEGFTRAFAQRHRWRRELGSLEDFLFLEAKKYIRRTPGHIMTGKENTITGDAGPEIDLVPSSESTEQENLERTEHRRAILASLHDETEKAIVIAIMDGEDLAASELAAIARVSVNEVYQATRRLKGRRALKDQVENMLKQANRK